DQAVRDRKLTNPADKEAAIDEVLPYIRAVRSRIQKREYFDIAMDSLRVGDPALRREFWQGVRSSPSEETERPRVVRRRELKPTVSERRLLEWLLAEADLRRSILLTLTPDDYEDLATAPIFRALLELEREGLVPDYDNLSGKISEDTAAEDLLPLLPLLLIGEPSSDNDEGAGDGHTAQSCLAGLRLESLDRKIMEISQQMAEAERLGDLERLNNLVFRQIELTRRRGTMLPQAEAMQTGL
ncbi:MAG: hypothetical protein ABJB97_09360, partial [Acidobacteriota bacterium]